MPQTKYRVAIAGFAHMHINNVAALFAAHPQVEMVACADTVPDRPELREGPYTRGWNMKHALEKLGVKTSYADYRQMLAAERPHIVICCSENVRHPEVVEACAEHGANVCVEKPMAMSLQHALRMVRAAKAAGITVLINWPITWDGAVRRARELIDAGEIGQVLQVKWRGGHTGPLGPGATHAGVSEAAAPLSPTELAATWWHHDSTGGGAFLDYCCYGCLVARWLIGQGAVAAVGLRANLNSQWADGDDNGAMLARFPNAIGLFEASWTTWDHGVPNGPIVYGQKGTLVVETVASQRRVRLERGGGRTTIFDPAPLPPERDNIAREFIYHLETRQPVHPTLDLMFNLEAMAILDAGYRSCASGKMELVNSAAWCTG